MRYGSIIGCLLFMAAFTSCSKPDVKETKGQQTYFDLKGFFQADAARLTRKHPLISKTVIHNDQSQTRKVHIDNWASEFELFTNSDINKPAWRDSYTVSKNDSVLVYTAKNPALVKTSRIIITKSGNKVKWILIYNHTKNMLYENTEKLTYFPDSAYIIVKLQKVRLLGKNLYTIKGVF